MSASHTENPAWIYKVKMRFSHLDRNKDGLIDYNDIATIAKNMAKFGKKGTDAEQRYHEALINVWSFGLQGMDNVDADKFVEGIRKFVVQPDVKERIIAYADAHFEVLDANGDGVITPDEMHQYCRAVLDMDDEMIDIVFKEEDLNHDGVITLAEKRQALLQFFLTA